VILTESSTAPLDSGKSHKMLWPKSLVWIHPAECPFGARLNNVPLLRSCVVNTQLVWFLLGMITMIPEIWSCTVKSQVTEIYTNQWNGWFLRIASLQCLNINKKIPRGLGRQHPFARRKCKVSELLEKSGSHFQETLFQPQHITELFTEAGTSIVCLPFSRHALESFWTSIVHDTEACIFY
jgi:hypothetical protein